MEQKIIIKNATANNLKGLNLEMPHHQLIVVTGISGSGKSSLAFDVIAKEGQRRYFETLPIFAQQFAGKISPVDAESIEGLSPVVTVSQKTTGTNARSTVGTISDIYSWLRLLYARVGKIQEPIAKNKEQKPPKLTRSLFSFNAPLGKCMCCNGIGKEEKIDLKKLINQPEKTIREGALAPTLPTGYIMYSQVTIDVLNNVCQAEGFSVDTVWNELPEQAKQVVLYGSNKIKVPFGKHSLESRLKWTGIKAKPREEGYYKGMIPIMTDILKRDRNANILKYVSAVVCSCCKGKRLNNLALSVKVNERTIVDLLELPLVELAKWLNQKEWGEVAGVIIKKIQSKINLLSEIGLGYLNLNHSAKKLSGSEIQRIKIANQLEVELSNVLYVFDEPSIGLHVDENKIMLGLLKKLVKEGNTVIVVEHDLETIKNADWIIDLGPKAGKNGGELLFNGTKKMFLQQKETKYISPTLKALLTYKTPTKKQNKQSTEKTTNAIHLNGCNQGYLQNINAEFPIGKITVVTGKSGTGKADLVKETLKPLIENHLKEEKTNVHIQSYKNIDKIDRLVYADQSPIGRTPRSNPATYIGLSDKIRTLFAKLPQAKENKLTRTHFSFNTKGGRCETCQGAGKTQIGMHFLGKVDLICRDCNGKRFNEKTLSIHYKNKNISDIYNLAIEDAIVFFEMEKNIVQGLGTLQKMGLGYLTLGQSSTTLSGGEAQRIKLASELQKKSTGKTLFIIDEPSIGLHPYDIKNILGLFDELKKDGNTIVCIEQDELIINKADHLINLTTPTTKKRTVETVKIKATTSKNDSIELEKVSTHLLKNISVKFPKQKLTVVTGLSGSGKSTLVYDSLFAEANSRFNTSLSTFNRSFIQAENTAKIKHAKGLTPTIAIKRKKAISSNRSTIGTSTGINDNLRLLFSRIANHEGKEYTAQHFSFNHKLGACTQCKGKGNEKKCDPEQLITDPEKPLFEGALTTNKEAQYFLNIDGQFIAILKEIAQQKNWDLTTPWHKLTTPIKNTILYGTGEEQWTVNWKFKTKTRTGEQNIQSKWLGFCNYINQEFERRQNNKNIQHLLKLLHKVPCEICNGNRLKKELLKIRYKEKNIAEISQLTAIECIHFFSTSELNRSNEINAITEITSPKIQRLLKTINTLGIGYLTLNRTLNSLSGGELQRVQLAGQLSAQLFGVTYVLDEPTTGLDTAQISALINLLNQLKENGNTIIVIEHNKQFIKAAEYIIELGPESGKKGGEIIFQGKKEELKNYPNSLTNKVLYAELQSPYHNHSLSIDAKTSPPKPFGIKKAFAHNLKNINITFKTNRLTAITGVSGSGKSTLLKSVLYESIQKKRPVGCHSLFGFDYFDSVLLIDQTPIALNTLACPASFIGVLDQFQTLFARTEKAKKLQLKKADFSYLSKTGKCPNCKGYGKIKTALDFMSDLWIECEICEGKRYNQKLINKQAPTLLSAENGKKPNTKFTIAEILTLTFNSLNGLFDDKKLNKQVDLLTTIGLGHLQLGQGGNTLSCGEAQRLKIAKGLMNQKGKNLYLFDEPSTGLHPYDLSKIITLFNQLIENGQTILFIEHDETLISTAHHQIKLGPKGGEFGGELL